MVETVEYRVCEESMIFCSWRFLQTFGHACLRALTEPRLNNAFRINQRGIYNG